MVNVLGDIYGVVKSFDFIWVYWGVGVGLEFGGIYLYDV